MSRFTDHPELYDKPICLSEAAKCDPMLTIREFFAEYRLSSLREIQDQIQRTCLTTEGPAFDGPEGRSTLLRYSDKLIVLLEAASHLQQTFAASEKASIADHAMIQHSRFMCDYTRAAELAKGLH